MSLSSIGSLLRIRAGVVSDEFSDDAIESFVSHGISQVASSLSSGAIAEGSAEEALALLYSMADIAYARASNAALSYHIRSQRGETDRQQIVENNLNIVKYLRSAIEELKEKLSGDETVFVGNLIRVNRFGQEVPLTLQDAPSATTLSLVVDSGDVELTWTESTAADFSQYKVWRDTTENMIDPMTYTSAESADNLGLVSTSENIKTILNRWKTYYKDEPVAGTYYYTIETIDNSGRRTFSSVVQAVVA